jgi:hypothetical protein
VFLQREADHDKGGVEVTTLIPYTTGLTIFGDMTLGNGINGIFSGGYGYKEATVGYAGYVFASPANIAEMKVDSAALGFDASGSTTSITLELYARESGTPANSTDGTLLGTLSFTDVNAAQTKTIPSSNQSANFSCAWIRVTTGVWALCSNALIYSNPSGGVSMTVSDEQGASM